VWTLPHHSRRKPPHSQREESISKSFRRHSHLIWLVKIHSLPTWTPPLCPNPLAK
jgi:hypothetical protein